MSRKKFIDEHGYKTCTKCEVTFIASRDFFHTCNRNIDGLCCRCKKCSNLERNERQKSRKSHNIPRHCITCGSFFWAALADINKMIRRTGRQGGIFCSKKCCFLHHTRGFGLYTNGRKGISWEGKRRGSNNPNAKYDEYIIKKAKQLIKNGIRLVDISKELKITQNYLSHIKHGRAWASVVI